MLKLSGITKDYIAGNTKVHALKGVDITFRESEFVSILGHSGCGKTTLLNIIGGLDHCTSGNLFIDGVSTEKFSDRDWDTYRNHRVGFIFQSYNLIPHQTILGNVELALTIAGIDMKERTRRAKEALDKVGLKDLYEKKPNQLSGGQCQRVAIARALVNEPEILLADEPTGALDSETSIQIMELIKEIAKERLVIMVTHNPELAEQYSTRIIRLSDGNVLSDSNPYDGEEEEPVKNKKDISKKSKLSFWSAFKLSAKNLLSKSKRTFLVCFAGSIGIIGIALVLAISSGVQGYINAMQNDMLAGNPITINESTLDLNAMMSSMDFGAKKDALKEATEDGYVNVNSMIEYLTKRQEDLSSMMLTNDITQEYIDYLKAMPKEYYAAIDFNYNLDVSNNIYTDYQFTNHSSSMSLSAAKQVFTAMLNQTDVSEYASLVTSISDSFMQAPDNAEFILSQYNFLTSAENSKIATEDDEIMIVVSSERELSDLLFAQLGYYSQDEFINLVYKATNSDKYDPSREKTRFSYDELLGKTFTYYPNNTVYNKIPSISPLAAARPFTYNAYENKRWTTGKKLKITAILVQKEGQNYGCLESGFYYTSAFAKSILADSLNSEIVNYLVENEQDAFTSMEYINTDAGTSISIGITFNFNYYFEGVEYSNVTGYVGSTAAMTQIIGSMMGQEMPTYYTLSLRDLGGCALPNGISIYPVNLDYKDSVTDYLDAWNSDATITVNGETYTAEQRNEIVYNDTLSLIMSMLNSIVKLITYALVAFTALALVVSTVMIAIITYVSVIERIKEIGVIRSLGGRKRDVSALFVAETIIIGAISGVFGIAITYLLSLVINLIIGSLAGITTIASLPFTTALVMITLSIMLTLISGVIPARLAAKKDPVEALRTE